MSKPKSTLLSVEDDRKVIFSTRLERPVTQPMSMHVPHEVQRDRNQAIQAHFGLDVPPNSFQWELYQTVEIRPSVYSKRMEVRVGIYRKGPDVVSRLDESSLRTVIMTLIEEA